MKLKSLLIANRGEIASRIIKTASGMGIKTYCFQTAKEPNALYLENADVVIHEKDESSSIFLNAEKIVNYAKDIGIDAIHPGYGFLAEDPLLARLCKEEGILFVGPDATIIETMGNKGKARELAENAGIPIVKGSKRPALNLSDVKEDVEDIDYPVILKALAGGGGKGMRIVRNPQELEPMYKMACGEAINAFGNGDMLVEKFIERPHHIEVQVLADKQGNALHLFERECSIQRNHQKLLEEAPAPNMSGELRNKITTDALKLVKETGYFTLGTVEFLLDEDGSYYFMEMNTRIQVEHPVTEAITGLDLVQLQIETACGNSLTLRQEDVKMKGCAIEFRVNAEDPQNSFAPNFGIIDELSFKAQKGLRIDAGYLAGSVIPNLYDSLIAKLIVSAKNREEVISKALQVMGNAQVEGVKTTIPFFKAVLRHPDFIEGDFTTSFVSEMNMLYFQEENEEEAAAALALQYYLDEIRAIESETVGTGNATPWISRMLNKIS